VSGMRLTMAQEAELWRRRKAGERLGEIARALGQPYDTLYGRIAARGGCAPAERRRHPRVLSLCEREEISRGLSARCSIRQIARRLGRSASTISREIRRHGAQEYRALEADRRAWQRARRPKPCRLSQSAKLKAVVARMLGEEWSPKQISRWLPKAFADDHSMRVSHETIYRSLFIQSRNVLKKQLQQHLRTRRRLRHVHHANKPATHGQIVDAISIRERPAEAEDRAVPGHWEGDLLEGSKGTQIATLVERHSRFVMLVRIAHKDSTTVVKALSKTIKRLPQQLRRSLTWDRGTEMHRHKDFTIATNVQVYFCDPSSPWQRGSNENTNGLLRQYFPKGTDLSMHSQAHLNYIARKLNQRPRETLDFETPADTLARSVASTA
jgi:transposase, IS30 family